ncbi:delta-like protein C isoform X1 [Ptychodera flava]|uniref:delta-like protein C isoform X1 n=1 Tax=Ptychodera flava TaxID=63121 RepID=UPI00396A2F8D
MQSLNSWLLICMITKISASSSTASNENFTTIEISTVPFGCGHGCLNNHSCQTGQGSHCACTSGKYDGYFCEIDTSCNDTTRPCLNGGSCVNYEGTTRCVCVSPFTGASCETNMACVDGNGDCLNGGVCNKGSCTCPGDFTGAKCEMAIPQCTCLASIECDTLETCQCSDACDPPTFPAVTVPESIGSYNGVPGVLLLFTLLVLTVLCTV